MLSLFAAVTAKNVKLNTIFIYIAVTFDIKFLLYSSLEYDRYLQY